MTYYRVKDWQEKYETSETRKYKALSWAPMSNKHDGLGFKRITQEPDAAALYAAWCLIVQVASKGTLEERGTLMRDGAPLEPADLALITGFPEEIFSRAFSYFSSRRSGWLEKVCSDGETGAEPVEAEVGRGVPPSRSKPLETSAPAESAGTPEDSAGVAGIDRKNRKNRTEEKEKNAATAATRAGARGEPDAAAERGGLKLEGGREDGSRDARPPSAKLNGLGKFVHVICTTIPELARKRGPAERVLMDAKRLKLEPEEVGAAIAAWGNKLDQLVEPPKDPIGYLGGFFKRVAEERDRDANAGTVEDRAAALERRL